MDFYYIMRSVLFEGMTKEQVEAILAEKQGVLEKVIEDTKHEKE